MAPGRPSAPAPGVKSDRPDVRPAERHERAGPAPASGRQSWWFAAWGPCGTALWHELVLDHTARRSWLAVVLVGDGRGVLTIDDDLAWPRPERYLEVRGHGAWAHHVCEEPLARWSLALEATAVAHDDPSDGLGTGWGDPDGLAHDLEWEATGPAVGSGLAYGQPCRVDGVLERVGVRHVVDGWDGARGRRRARHAGVVVAGRVGTAAVVHDSASRWSGRELPRHVTVKDRRATASCAPVDAATWRWRDGEHAFATVAMSASDGRTGRGLARWDSAGTSGVGA